MQDINAKLNQLIDQMARRHKLKAVVADLEQQRSAQSQTVQKLKEQTYKEQLDVDRLENFSATKLFYLITGSLDERMEKEQEELYAAALRYDTARRELEAVEVDLASCRQELNGLQNCEREYQRLLAEKAKLLKEMNSFYADKLCALEERIAYLTSQEKELREAVSAADRAESDLAAIIKSLNSAEGWGTFDLFGGGLVTDLAKHSHLDTAQRQINALQRSLSRLRTELADIAIQSDLQVQVDGFLRFADYFFDDFFSSWAVMDRIHKAKSQMVQLEYTVRSINARLESRLNSCILEKEAKQKERNDFVLKA